MEDNSKESVIPLNREQVDFSVGASVIHIPSGKNYKIKRQIDFSYIECQCSETGRLMVLPILSLSKSNNSVQVSYPDLNSIEPDDWKEAERRYNLILPLLNGEISGRKEIDEYAKNKDIGRATLYRWFGIYKATRSVSSLIPKQRGWREGNSRLTSEQDKIINDVIKEYYLSPQRLSQHDIFNQIKIVCSQRNITRPTKNSIRKRILSLSAKDVLYGRGQPKKAQDKFAPKAGMFPNVLYPLDVIQIDHTPVDLILVDDLNRQPIGRPWVTFAIDVYSRMILGYYLSLDAPSEIAVAMCIAHAVLPKEEWLAAKEITGEWKVWGIPKKIHVDNGPDFRTETLRRACLEYDINLEFRPVKVPNYGGHIERLVGTFMKETHKLKGTTFSNIQERKEYDSEKYACLTFDEAEAWILKQIVSVYHKEIHSTLNMSPTSKWSDGIYGTDYEIGCGLPHVPANPKTVMLDFMPFEERTIQNTGVTWDGVRYFDFILAPYIGLRGEDGKARKYIFRRDPRDISIIYFLNPDTKNYIPIPVSNQNLPSTSLWQLRASKKRLKERGLKDYNEHQIIETLIEMEKIVDNAAAQTKKMRRIRQRSKIHQKNVTPVQPIEKQKRPENEASIKVDGLLDTDFIQPFEDIQ
ncbi:transposase [Acinetobacter baumannii]|jgi:putative transposase|uniref:Mu transposase C-terminal domain-containing protein n=1 Tax=Acinetobacter TaxID=469 RepID=UPI000DE78411|nr:MULTISPECIES: Mu transposase C-terminal domain-containing protein [Acinetobacter]ELS4592030.1 DDE-type integrase/transposase/recombinase [Acinetobacter baumannii]MBJ8465354.1 DDE-type integrase/transposase/recombinase [Acinetobacter nosocomialis]MBT1522680.1 DDE-type integrase/transposase/recombinase [Acinetobacter pittii]MCH7381808.1 DDE-type integrase/transposase/recombinase [Acinetobacter higginsii]MDA3578682.1 DDE-type integrase/transposase/recombinase [Acinetobacter ursingii]